MYRSLSAKALGLRQGEVLTVLEEGGSYTVRRNGGEANDMIRDAVLGAVAFTPDGQPRIRKDSVVYRAGVQIRLRL